MFKKQPIQESALDKATAAHNRRVIINSNSVSTSNSNLIGVSSNGLLPIGQWTAAQINPYSPQNNIGQINTYPVVPANSIRVNEFASVLDDLFTGEEKKDFITSIGYIVNGGFASKANQQNSDVIRNLSESIDVVFLREISIKFKNMLLAKPILKIKL